MKISQYLTPTCLQSIFFIEIDSIEDVDRLGSQYDVDVLVTRYLSFDSVISVVLYYEELKRELY